MYVSQRGLRGYSLCLFCTIEIRVYNIIFFGLPEESTITGLNCVQLTFVPSL